jgi:2-methylaconitate cis-trans-isomerase PrpF
MRGGTSKGLFFYEKDLPPPGEWRDRVLLAAFGSPDPRQINGLGGATSTTSKAAIIAPANVEGIDVNYTFGQVSVNAPQVDYHANCGNISSAVGPFAVDEGLVPVEKPQTLVRIFNTNTGKLIEARVPVVDGGAGSPGLAAVEGETRIAGVPEPGACIAVTFVDPGGSVTGRLLPTGRVRERLTVSGWGKLEVSMVDAGNPAVFFRAADIGLKATEGPDELDGRQEILDLFEQIRCAAAVAMGLADDAATATKTTPSVPKVAAVAPPAAYRCTTGESIGAEELDLVALIMSMQRTHPAYALTGAVATSAAAALDGSIVAEVIGGTDKSHGRLRLGHPGGVMICGVAIDEEGPEPRLRVTVERTARRLMDGYVYVPARLWPEDEG